MTELDDSGVDDKDRAGLARRWATDLDQAKNADKDFIKAGRKIVERYRDKRGATDNARKYNILWSNVQTLLPAVYAKKPQVQVQRRFKDADPVGRCASQILERALQFEIDHYSDYDSSIKNCVLDRLLPGRGTTWVRFEPSEDSARSKATEAVEGAEQVTDDSESESMGAYECSPCDYVFWEDFRHSPARTWEEVSWVARLVYMGKDEGIERFGDLFKDAPLAHEPIGIDQMKSDGMAADQIDRMKKAKVWEIWSKPEKKVYWHAEGFQKILDARDDPLELEGFFPCPKPLYATLTSDTLVAVPDFKQYQDQAKEMDELTARIALLVKAVKVVGVYDASHEGIARMMNEGVDNQLIPVSTWAMFAEKGGLKGAVDFMPVDSVLLALTALYAARDQVKQIIYEITGLSDIIRGASVASETATAQKIKSQFASLRLKSTQNEVARFASDLLRMKAQIMCSLYRPEVLVAMSSMQTSPDAQHIPQALELLQNDVLRAFRIEVATDSLVELDEAGEKASRMEFLTAVGGFLREAIQAPPEMAPLLGEMLMFGVRSFKSGTAMESSLEQFIAQQAEKAKQPKPEQPNPEMLKMQADQQAEQGRMQLEQAKMQATAQGDQMKLQADMQLAQGKAQFDMQLEQMRTDANVQIQREKETISMQIEQMRIEQKATAEAQRLEFDRWDAELKAQTQIYLEQLKLGNADPIDTGGDINNALATAIEGIRATMESVNRPKTTTFIRDKQGRATGAVSE